MNHMSSEDKIAAMRAEMDQAKAARKELAEMITGFVKELRDAGMSKKESMQMGREMLRTMMTAGYHE